MDWLHRLLVFWTVASLLHLPFPVPDEDLFQPVGQYQPADSDPLTFFGVLARLDFDFILLGCLPPADPDQAPFDYDPEQAADSPFGSSFLGSGTRHLPIVKSISFEKLLDLRASEANGIHVLCFAGCPHVWASRFDYAFGKLCGIGLSRLRC